MWNVWRIAGPCDAPTSYGVGRDRDRRRRRGRAASVAARDCVHAWPSQSSNVSPRQNSARGASTVNTTRSERRGRWVMSSSSVARSDDGASTQSPIDGIEPGPHVAAEVVGDRRHRARRPRPRRSTAIATDDAHDLAGRGSGAACRRRAAATCFGVGPVDEHERDERRRRPAHEQRARVGARERRVAQRAEPAEPEQHDHDPPGRQRRQREHAEQRRRRAPASAPTTSGNPIAARRDRADRAERERGRHRDDAPRRSARPRRTRLRSRTRSACAHARTTSTGQPSGGAPGSPGTARASRRPRSRAIDDRRRDRAAGFAACSTRPRRPRRAWRARCRRRGSRRPRPRRAVRSGRRRARRRRAGGGSCSRTTSVPRRALVGQCTSRAASPGTYGPHRAHRVARAVRRARTRSTSAPSCGRGAAARGARPASGRGATVELDRQLDADDARADEDAERRRRAELDPDVRNTPRRPRRAGSRRRPATR